MFINKYFTGILETFTWNHNWPVSCSIVTVCIFAPLTFAGAGSTNGCQSRPKDPEPAAPCCDVTASQRDASETGLNSPVSFFSRRVLHPSLTCAVRNTSSRVSSAPLVAVLCDLCGSGLLTCCISPPSPDRETNSFPPPPPPFPPAACRGCIPPYDSSTSKSP